MFCTHCHQSSDTPWLCSPCWSLWESEDTPCRRCARTELKAGVCVHCMESPPPWESLHIAFPYEGFIQRCIHQLKFQDRLSMARFLGDSFLRHGYPLSLPDALISVPMHLNRWRKRGYNPAEYIARYLAKQLNIPYYPQAVGRSRETLPQGRLPSREARLRNVSGAFVVNTPHLLSGKRVALIDDVYTTGATVAAVTVALQHAGASSVSVWAMASGRLSS